MNKQKILDAYWSKMQGFQLYDLRVKLIFKHIDAYNLKTLEVGCGPVTDSLLLAQKGARTTCLDISKNAINLAKKHMKDLIFPVNL